MTRELDKIVQKQDQFRQIISSTHDPNEIYDLVTRAANLAIPFPSKFAYYKRLYQSELRYAKNNGYHVKRQQDILEWLNNAAAAAGPR